MQKKRKRSPKAKPLRERAGRPQYEPTDHDRTIVRSMVRAGITQNEICKVLNLSPHTLEKHFRREIDTAAADANEQVANALFLRATTGEDSSAVTAAIFWLKCRAGWRDVARTELVGEDGGAIKIEAAREALAARLEAAIARTSGNGSSKPDSGSSG